MSVDSARRQMRDGARQILAALEQQGAQGWRPADVEILGKIAGWETPEEQTELWRRARAVVDERYRGSGSDWEKLSDRIAELADIVGGGELKHG